MISDQSLLLSTIILNDSFSQIHSSIYFRLKIGQVGHTLGKVLIRVWLKSIKK